MDEMMRYARENIKFYQSPDYRKKRVDDRSILLESGSMLNQKFMDYPHRNRIRILHGFSENGVYRRIYWLEEDLKHTEEPVWKRRGDVAGIKEESRFCGFFTTWYKRNTLLNPHAFHQEENRLWICRDQLVGEKMRQALRWMEEFDPEWIQMDEVVAKILLKYLEAHSLPHLKLAYIEIVNSNDSLICNQVKERFRCEVRRVCFSELFGVTAYENSLGELELLRENVEVHFDGGQTLLSTKCNRLMPILCYPTKDCIKLLNEKESRFYKVEICQNMRDSSLTKLKSGEFICACLFLRPAEFINERIGRIIFQIQIVQRGEVLNEVRVGINPSYFGWQDEIKKMFRQYLYLEELEKVNVEFQFHKMFFEEDAIILR